MKEELMDQAETFLRELRDELDSRILSLNSQFRWSDEDYGALHEDQSIRDQVDDYIAKLEKTRAVS